MDGGKSKTVVLTGSKNVEKQKKELLLMEFILYKISRKCLQVQNIWPKYLGFLDYYSGSCCI